MAWLVGSRVAIAAVAGAVLLAWRVEQPWREAARDPLHRISNALALLTPEALRTLDADLAELSRSGHRQSAQVIALLALLKQNRMTEARAACAAMSWPHCDDATVREMRELILQ